MRILLVIAGLMGASGVAVEAAAAHAYPGAGLDSAGRMLLVHAAALAAVTAALDRALLARGLGMLAAAGMVVGTFLFSGDVVLGIFTSWWTFSYAAPTGGIVLILSWFVVAVAAAAGSTRSI